MTGQIADEFRYNGQVYDLVGIAGEGLFSAEDFGITTRPASTACWRGFQMIYDCVDGELLLEQMNVSTSNPISVNGIEPKEGSIMFSHIYESLKLKTHFTGKIRLGKDFIQDMYVHMGFQSAESYATVIELEIENGDIIEETNLSGLMKERRRLRREKPSHPLTMDDDDVKGWIRDRFSQDYDSE